MDTKDLDQYIARAKGDPEFLRTLADNPERVISDFDAIQQRVLSAIASMSPAQAMGELLGASSNDHCPRCSCGQTSYAPVSSSDGAFLRP